MKDLTHADAFSHAESKPQVLHDATSVDQTAIQTTFEHEPGLSDADAFLHMESMLLSSFDATMMTMEAAICEITKLLESPEYQRASQSSLVQLIDGLKRKCEKEY